MHEPAERFASQTVIADASGNHPEAVVTGVLDAADRHPHAQFELVGPFDQLPYKDAPNNVSLVHTAPSLSVVTSDGRAREVQGRRVAIHLGMSRVMKQIHAGEQSTFLSDAHSRQLSVVGAESMHEIPGVQGTPFVSQVTNNRGFQTLVVSEEDDMMNTEIFDPLRSIHRFFMARVLYDQLLRKSATLQREKPILGWHTFAKDIRALSEAEREAMIAIATAGECNAHVLVTDPRSGEADIVFSSADASHLSREMDASISWLQGVQGGCAHVSASSNPNAYRRAAEQAMDHNVQTQYADVASRIARPRIWSDAA